jgi:glutathione S-transferase
MNRFTLYGSPHSLPTYKVALMLHMCGEPFSFRYVSFQLGMHKTEKFKALSRWGQVPVLMDGDRALFQSGSIVEYLASAFRRFQGTSPEARQAAREWLYWDMDTLYPPVFGCYSVLLDRAKLLKLEIQPAIAAYHHLRAESALSVLDSHLVHGQFLCETEPTIADLFCCGDVAFAELCDFQVHKWTHLAIWMQKMKSLTGFRMPFDLLQMRDAESL